MIGIDIVAIRRIEKLIDKYGDRALSRFLSKDEMSLAKKAQSVAGFFAAKEAISKALGCGIGKELSFKDIEIFKDSKNAPQVRFNKDTKKRHKIKKAYISITHDGGFAIAVCKIKKKKDKK